MTYSATPIKRTAVERMVNTQILFLFAILLSLSVGSAIGSIIRSVSVQRHRKLSLTLAESLLANAQYSFADQMWYVMLETKGNKAKAFVEDVLTFIILYNNLIPIS